MKSYNVTDKIIKRKSCFLWCYWQLVVVLSVTVSLSYFKFVLVVVPISTKTSYQIIWYNFDKVLTTKYFVPIYQRKKHAKYLLYITHQNWSKYLNHLVSVFYNMICEDSSSNNCWTRPTWGTGARRNVVDSCTDGSRCADVVKEARVHAVVLDARPVRWAVRVDVTLHCLTAYERVTNETWEEKLIQYIHY